MIFSNLTSSMIYQSRRDNVGVTFFSFFFGIIIIMLFLFEIEGKQMREKNTIYLGSDYLHTSEILPLFLL